MVLFLLGCLCSFLDVSIPEKPKLRFIERVPLVPKVRREPKNLRDIRGPSTEATEFTEGSFAILVSEFSVKQLHDRSQGLAKSHALRVNSRPSWVLLEWPPFAL